MMDDEGMGRWTWMMDDGGWMMKVGRGMMDDG
jgi:hypothetical protein